MHVAIVMAASWLFSAAELAAQSAPRVLVVVANVSDAECVKRIGGEHVQVEPLFAPEVGAVPNNYAACYERVRGLLDFRLFLFRDESYCPSGRFWRDRMAIANPPGKLHRLSRSRRGTVTESKIQQANDVHGALASVLPAHRASLDANLAAELDLLHWLRLHRPEERRSSLVIDLPFSRAGWANAPAAQEDALRDVVSGKANAAAPGRQSSGKTVLGNEDQRDRT